MTVLSMILRLFVSNFSATVGFGEAWAGLCLTTIWSVIDIREIVIKVVFGLVSVFVNLVDSASCWCEFSLFCLFFSRLMHLMGFDKFSSCWARKWGSIQAILFCR